MSYIYELHTPLHCTVQYRRVLSKAHTLSGSLEWGWVWDGHDFLNRLPHLQESRSHLVKFGTLSKGSSFWISCWCWSFQVREEETKCEGARSEQWGMRWGCNWAESCTSLAPPCTAHVTGLHSLAPLCTVHKCTCNWTVREPQFTLLQLAFRWNFQPRWSQKVGDWGCTRCRWFRDVRQGLDAAAANILRQELHVQILDFNK